MPYPVTQLITEAFYTSGIVSRQFQTVQGDQSAVGFIKLNEILTDTAVDEDMIPYFNSGYNFNAVAGQETYFIPNLVEAETLTFFINQVRYSMRKNPRDQYFGMGRAQNINSLPFNWHIERVQGGALLFIYFFPDQNFPLQLTGLFRLQAVTIDQDLEAQNPRANLGTAFFTPVNVPPLTVNLQPGNLVINGHDFQGAYQQVGPATPVHALQLAINNALPGFIASTVGTDFIITGPFQSNIVITTNGTTLFTNNITFENFSTINGPFNQTYFPQGLDKYYINYLQYKLAERLCIAYNFAIPDGLAKQLLTYEQMISKRSSPIDFSMNKISTLDRQQSVNYGQVNLGKGWTSV